MGWPYCLRVFEVFERLFVERGHDADRFRAHGRCRRIDCHFDRQQSVIDLAKYRVLGNTHVNRIDLRRPWNQSVEPAVSNTVLS